jgi:hypothetical protein
VRIVVVVCGVALARALGLDPKKCGTIPFNIVNDTMVYSLEDIVLKNVEDQGMTFWWIDWQQGGQEGGATGDKVVISIIPFSCIIICE